MIDTAISHIASELNQHLKRSFDLSEDVVVVSNLLEQDGSVAPHANNKIVVSLVNIEKDSVPFQQQNFASGGGRSIVASPPLYFNLYLMFASYFSGSNYQEGLKFISKTISYFQGQGVFDQHNSPGLDTKINKLILDIENLDMQNLSSLWGMLSGKYLPSVLYKVRMVTYDSGAVKKQAPALTRPQPSLSH
ncbi:hypothetical protein Tel_12335 [Candidatus Tenderia electrophaga]|jgi:hypothetical protein|uniref:Pvc16 N-terminal domain-containing protein n=1 Tax=Candidatus Tenderia electrophaga TaxID=1748243 RepID=A0A0S2TFF2_9GAMM|nr:hypothetical protein Tel_12335 [Candidatus Tenderia electrophaga]